MTNEKYNGWTNYETWLVYLWLTNEQGTDAWARELCRSSLTTDHAACELMEQLPEYLNLPVTGMACDLINAALSRVDWLELAVAFREEG